jgi:hypothetical protein
MEHVKKDPGDFAGVVGHIIIPLVIFTGALVGLVVFVAVTMD